MELIGKIGLVIFMLAIASAFMGMFIPRQLLLKVKLESIPDFIKKPVDGYASILDFPLWMLNGKGRWFVMIAKGSFVLGLLLMGLPFGYDFLFN